MANDPYQELGVSRSASADEIRKAYRKLAKQYHPDRNPGDAASETRFKQVTAAFDLLGDEEKRRRYDRGEIDADGNERFRGFPGGQGGARGGFGGGGDPRGAGFEGIDLDDLFGIFGGGAGARGARGPASRGFAARGSDVRATLEISLEDAIKGTRQRIAFSDGRTLDVTIPAGVSDGQVLRLKGQGAPGHAGTGRPAQAGDALIELRIRPHPLFRIEGADLHMDLPVSVPDAVLGAKVEAQTPEGPVSVSIPKGASSGQVLRLKGRGGFAGGRRGDLLAKLMLVLPKTPDEALTRFAEEWRRKRPYRPGS